MRYFNSPQCPYCDEYPFDDENAFMAAYVGFSNDTSDPIEVECSECGKQFEIMELDVMGFMLDEESEEVLGKTNEELLRDYIEKRKKNPPLSTGIMMTVGSKENEVVTTEKINEEEQETEVREVSRLASSEEGLGQQLGVEKGSEVQDIDGGGA